MEVGQFVQLCDVIPVGVCEPAGTGVIHLALAIQDLGVGGWREEKTIDREHPKRSIISFFKVEKP